MKNTHLEHLEDNILNGGSQGGKKLVAFLRSLGDMLDQVCRARYSEVGWLCNNLWYQSRERRFFGTNLYLTRLVQRFHTLRKT